MRTCIVIGLLAVFIVVGIATLIFRPWESRLEYHKRKYLAAMENQITPPLFDRVIAGVASNASQTVDTRRRHREAFERHAAELVAIGYLERRAFWISGEPLAIAQTALKESNGLILEECARFAQFTWGTQNGRDVLGIIAVREDMPKWEELIRKADVP